MSDSMRWDTQPFAGPPRSGSRARRLVALGLSLILIVSLLPLTFGTLTALTQGDLGALFFYLVFLGLPASLGAVGAVLAFRRPENPIGWLLLVAGVCTGVAFACGEYERFAIAAGNLDEPAFLPAAWIASWLFIPAIGILVVFLPLLFPTGRLLSRRWRGLAILGIVGVTLGALGPAFAPGPLGDPRGPSNPFAPPEPLRTWIQLASTASNVVAPPVFLLAVGSLLLRFRRSVGGERQQIKWFLFVAVLASVAFGTSIVAPSGPVSDLAWVLGILTMAFLPVAIGLAILRYGLYEIDRIVNRAVVYGALTAVLAGVFAAATSLSQRIFVSVAGQSSDAAIVLTTLLVVAVYAPLRKRVESVVDRYFKYDQREFGSYLDELRRLLVLIDPTQAAQRLAREALTHSRATGVAITAADGRTVATAGAWPAEPVTAVHVRRPGSPLAEVLLGPRRDGKPHPTNRLAAVEQLASMVVEAMRPAATQQAGGPDDGIRSSVPSSPAPPDLDPRVHRSVDGDPIEPLDLTSAQSTG